MTDPFITWYDAVERRHMAGLTFQEIRRGVQALSTLYVEQRKHFESGKALDGAGKRAGFATFYGPLHFLLIREIIRALPAAGRPAAIFDLGSGTGVSGAAWALECKPAPRLTGIERNSWARQECKWTYAAFGLQGSVRADDLKTLKIPLNTAVIAAFCVNELDAEIRGPLLRQLLNAAGRGSSVLIVEPIARPLSDWWDDWSAAFVEAGGRDDRWRFPIVLPEKLRLMDKAAGLDHHELTARSLWLSGARAKVPQHVLP